MWIMQRGIYLENPSEVGSRVLHLISLLTLIALVVDHCSVVSSLYFIYKTEQLWLRESNFDKKQEPSCREVDGAM